MRVVILNDGETFSAIEGCHIIWVPDFIEGDDVDQFVKENAEYGTRMTDVFRAYDDSIK